MNSGIGASYPSGGSPKEVWFLLALDLPSPCGFLRGVNDRELSTRITRTNHTQMSTKDFAGHSTLIARKNLE